MNEPFDPDLFSKNLQTRWIGREFIYKKEVDSTNLVLKKIPSDQLRSGTVLLTDYQTSGRGQYEKKWVSNRNENLTLTVALCPSVTESYSLLTLACAYAIAEIVQSYTSQKVRIKWPNDLFIHEKKVGGLLTEATFIGNKPDRVLIGIGLNVFQQKMELTDSYEAVSIAEVSDKAISREILLCDCLQEIEKVFHQWEKSDSALILKINKKLIGYGEWVNLSIYNELLPQKFKFIGVSNKGELLMLNEQLDVNKFSYEQVRIIPIEQRVQSH